MVKKKSIEFIKLILRLTIYEIRICFIKNKKSSYICIVKKNSLPNLLKKIRIKGTQTPYSQKIVYTNILVINSLYPCSLRLYNKSFKTTIASQHHFFFYMFLATFSPCNIYLFIYSSCFSKSLPQKKVKVFQYVIYHRYNPATVFKHFPVHDMILDRKINFHYYPPLHFKRNHTGERGKFLHPSTSNVSLAESYQLCVVLGSKNPA